METKTITLRVRMKDWVKLRHLFPAERYESAADYIERLKEFLEARDYRKYGARK